MRFEDILSRYGVPYQTEGRYCRPGWLQFDCPFCDGGKDPNKPYCGFNLAGNYVHCWRCGAHNLTKTVSLVCRVDWPTALALTGDIERTRINPDDIKPQGKLIMPKGVGPLLSCHKRYLRKRRFDPDELKATWKIRGIGLASKLAWSIFIPIHYHGEVVSWTTRTLCDDGIRYISAGLVEESIPHKTLLFGEDFATTTTIICEGPFDVFAIGPGAVATLGTSTTPAQLLRMSRYPRRILCFDSEPAAQKRASVLCNQLAVFPGETFNLTLTADDPGSAKPRELRAIRKLLK